MKTVINSYSKKLDYDSIVELMDDDIREALSSAMAPCSEQEFFDAYCVKHQKKFREVFFANGQNPQY